MTKMELSINGLVKNMVTNDIFLATSLNRGYVNLSAVARDLKPTIEMRLGQDVNTEAIISALKRNRDTSRKYDNRVLESMAQTSVQMLTSVTKFVLPVNKNERVFREMYELKMPGAVYISTGTEFTTFIVEDRNLGSFSEIIRRGIVDRKTGLAVIIVKSPVSMIETPGYLMSLYSKLAFSGINVEETTNSYTDAIIVVSERDSSEAFMAIHDLIQYAREHVHPGKR